MPVSPDLGVHRSKAGLDAAARACTRSDASDGVRFPACLDGEAGGPQEDGALLAHGTGWMSPYQGDRYFEYGVLDRA